MYKTGGIISIIAGVFAVMAAFVTLMFGGVASAFHADKANTVVNLGWGGVFFSFTVIVFGAIAFSKPKLSGWGLIASSILGIVLGGTLVAIFMCLSLVGGILCLTGAKKVTTVPIAATSQTAPSVNMPDAQAAIASPHQETKRVSLKGVGAAFLAVVLVLAAAGRIMKSYSPGPSADANSPVIAQGALNDDATDLKNLENADDSKIESKIFTSWASVGNDPVAAFRKMTGTNVETSLQKQKREEDFQKVAAASKGKVVIWDVIVGNVVADGAKYVLNTKCEEPGPKLALLQQMQPAINATLVSRNASDKQAIESIGNCTVVKLKAVVAGTDAEGNILLNPAILVESSAYSAVGVRGYKDTVVAAAPVDATVENSAAASQAALPVATPLASSPSEEPITIDPKAGRDKEVLAAAEKPNTPSLAELDSDLNQTYKKLIMGLDKAKQADLKREEIVWIRAKDKECGSDSACLSNKTELRLQELKSRL